MRNFYLFVSVIVFVLSCGDKPGDEECRKVCFNFFEIEHFAAQDKQKEEIGAQYHKKLDELNANITELNDAHFKAMKDADAEFAPVLTKAAKPEDLQKAQSDLKAKKDSLTKEKEEKENSLKAEMEKEKSGYDNAMKAFSPEFKPKDEDMKKCAEKCLKDSPKMATIKCRMSARTLSDYGNCK